MKRANFTRLNARILTLGVPLPFLFFLIVFAIGLLFFMSLKWYLVLPFLFVLFLVVFFLYRFSVNWVKELSFQLSIPYKRFYKKTSCYLPSIGAIKKGYED